jgi:hypothetical protein
MWFFWNGFQAEPQAYVPQPKWYLSNRENNGEYNEYQTDGRHEQPALVG